MVSFLLISLHLSEQPSSETAFAACFSFISSSTCSLITRLKCGSRLSTSSFFALVSYSSSCLMYACIRFILLTKNSPRKWMKMKRALPSMMKSAEWSVRSSRTERYLYEQKPNTINIPMKMRSAIRVLFIQSVFEVRMCF